jgi:hypothetical protein
LPLLNFQGNGLARVVVIRHEKEPPGFRQFTISRFLEGLKERGHRILVVQGVDRLPDADMAVLHVNLSVVPGEYAAAAARYPVALNGKALDIRKRNVSRNILARDSGWTGPVIVKTDLNCGGLPEWILEAYSDLSKPPATAARPAIYDIFDGRGAVPESVWSDRRLIVERFLPERDERGFHTRSWIFTGDAGRCVRCRSADPVVKGRAIIDIEYVDVPEFIRMERKRLGLDFGKLDFVIHDGEPVLLDANKTPGQPPGERGGKDRAPFIDALEALLTRESLPV